MPTILRSALAREDLLAIWRRIADDSPNNADNFLDELESKFALLANSPEMGTLRPKYMQNLRSFPHKRYIIFYLPITNGIEIVRVFHASRDIARLFEEMS